MENETYAARAEGFRHGAPCPITVLRSWQASLRYLQESYPMIVDVNGSELIEQQQKLIKQHKEVNMSATEKVGVKRIQKHINIKMNGVRVRVAFDPEIADVLLGDMDKEKQPPKDGCNKGVVALQVFCK